MAQNATIGLNAKAYRNTGTYASPTWVELDAVRDVTLNLEKSMGDVSSRASSWMRSLPALKNASIEFELLYDGADTGVQAIRDAFLNDTLIDMAFMDGDMDTAGSQGLRAECHVENFSRSEPLEEPILVSVTLRPAADTTNVPTWLTSVGT